MRTVVLGPRPAELERLIEQRRATGADHHDEVWDGEYHMAPAANNRHNWLQLSLGSLLLTHARRVGLTALTEFNIGRPDDHRIPDLGLLRRYVAADWNPTAELVIEIVSPHDESRQKFDFYAAHGVTEIVIVDADDCSVEWFGLNDDHYVPLDLSSVLDIDVDAFAAQIDWPPTD